MTARTRMTQRALVERYTPGAVDDSGNPAPGAGGAGGWASHLAALPCWLYESQEQETVTAETTAVATDLKLMVPLAADVTEQDRIASIKDRLGAVIEAGYLHVETVIRKRTHKQLTLARVSG